MDSYSYYFAWSVWYVTEIWASKIQLASLQGGSLFLF